MGSSAHTTWREREGVGGESKRQSTAVAARGRVAGRTSVFTVADPRTPFSRDRHLWIPVCPWMTSPPDDAFASFGRAAPLSLCAPHRSTTRPFNDSSDLHAYDKTDLEPRVESVDDASSDWRRETVSFQAGYGNERALAHLFLPKRSTPPYQIVVYLGGSDIHTFKRVEDIGRDYQFILRGGRAVVIPVLWHLGKRAIGARPPVNQARVRDREVVHGYG